MKKVTAFVGSPRRKHTFDTVHAFLRRLESSGGIESEVLLLSEFNVNRCRGCCVCFNRGEEFCPFRTDDRDSLIGKMMASDAVVFASPVYSFQVSAVMKTFLDRLGFVFHRPRFFGKTFTSLVVQGIRGGPKVVEYLDFVGAGLGFAVVRGSSVTTLEPITDRAQKAIDRTLDAHSRRFLDQLHRPAYSAPTFQSLARFRFSRTVIKGLDETYRDYSYYRDQGWFESDYYYPVGLNPLKRAAGRAFDYAASRAAS